MKPLLAITMGDPAGVGAEVIVKNFAQKSIYAEVQPFVIGDCRCLEQAQAQTGMTQTIMPLLSLSELEQRDDVLQVIESTKFDFAKLQMGKINAACGRVAVKYFEHAIDLALSNNIDGIVTCPINKEAIHAAGYTDDIGHQEILARKTDSKLTATMLMTEGLKVAHLSTHLSLGDAVKHVKTPILVEKLVLTAEHLRQWMGKEPKIAVAALNPHGGEGGLIGKEEIEEILPAVIEARQQGLDIVGPYPADSVFYRAVAGEFDAVLALYHDQGHIAIKMHNFEDSITATMGIPFIRTSVDHGTAFDIAGQNMANAVGLSRAIDAAVSMMHSKLH
ncbi:MAG: 4-hydroxythreonine-4-phosphate dehydrogenase PdxA [Pseudomonadales bacterium]|nr:4-hydroxythreonine-4-phosphate dehydrogenase PdxA [Pseudomonadales bacterium]